MIYCKLLNKNVTKEYCLTDCILWDDCEVIKKGLFWIFWDWIKKIFGSKVR